MGRTCSVTIHLLTVHLPVIRYYSSMHSVVLGVKVVLQVSLISRTEIMNERVELGYYFKF